MATSDVKKYQLSRQWLIFRDVADAVMVDPVHTTSFYFTNACRYVVATAADQQQL